MTRPRARSLVSQAGRWLAQSLVRVAVPATAAMLVAAAVFCIVVWSAGFNPLSSLVATFQGAFGSSLGLRETLSRSIPIMLCALAVAVPARAGVFNIGAEGQLYCGAIATTAIALDAKDYPRGVVLVTMLLCAGGAGAAWAAITGLLKAVWKVNEILVALMLNYVAILAAEHFVHGPWRDQSALGWPYTAYFPQSAILSTWGKTNIHMGLVLAITAAVVLDVLHRRTTFGLSTRVVDANPKAARYAGIPVAVYVVSLLALGGVFASWAGVGEVSVVQGRLRPGISPGYGYVGFLISWLTGHRFLAILPAAVLAGGLYSGADELQLTAGLPSSSADILLGLLFVTVLVIAHLRQRLSARFTQPAKQAEER